MRKRLTHGLLFVAGFLTTQPLAPTAASQTASFSAEDPRLTRLREYLKECDCPVESMAEEFLRASDRYDLDWRLLPSISVVESGGGKAAPGNNIFGWNCGKQKFRTVQHAIHLVAQRLAESSIYRDKELVDLLETYNPGRRYPSRVMAIMSAIGPERLSPLMSMN